MIPLLVYIGVAIWTSASFNGHINIRHELFEDAQFLWWVIAISYASVFVLDIWMLAQWVNLIERHGFPN